jgi:phage terminase small subunit
MDSVTKGNKMPRRWALFILEYPKDWDGQAAAIRAGFKPGRARIRASELLSKPEVRAAIADAEAKHLRQAGVTAVKVLTQLANLATSDVRRLFNDDGRLKQPADWDDATAAAVSSIEVFEEFAGKGEERTFIGYVKKIRLWDKNRSLENLAKHFKLLTEKIEFPDKDGKPQDIALLDNLQLAAKLMWVMEQLKAQTEEQKQRGGGGGKE